MGLDIFIDKVKSTNIAYFRKINFLIDYFENYAKYEIENLKYVDIDEESVIELINRCQQVLKDHSLAKDLLPIKEGFYFESTEYDKYYFEDVEEVLNTMTNIILPQFKKLLEDESIKLMIWY